MIDTDTKDAVIRRVMRLNVEHLRYRQIWDELDALRPTVGVDREEFDPRHLFIHGESGVGKSTVLKQYRDANPGYVDVDTDGTEYDIRPVVYTELPQPFTMMAFYKKVAKAMGAPLTAGGTIDVVKDQALGLIEQQRVEMLILDEMDYILTSQVSDKAAMEAMKSLTNLGNISVVCAGTSAARKLVNINFQYHSRFPAVKLSRFAECDDQFCALLRDIDAQIALPKPLGLADKEVQYPQMLYEMSQGVMRPLVRILQRAMTMVLKDNDVDDLVDNRELFVKALLTAKRFVTGDSEDEFQTLLNRAENDQE